MAILCSPTGLGNFQSWPALATAPTSKNKTKQNKNQKTKTKSGVRVWVWVSPPIYKDYIGSEGVTGG